MTSKKTTVVSGRVPHNIEKDMKMLNLKVPECVQIALQVKQDPQKLMEAELRSLLAEQEMLASRTAHVNLMIEDYMNKLNINKSVEELKQEFFIDNNEKAIQTTLKRFESARGESNMHINEYIQSKAGKRVFEAQLSKCDLTEEDFINALFERYERSIQTKLDS